MVTTNDVILNLRFSEYDNIHLLQIIFLEPFFICKKVLYKYFYLHSLSNSVFSNFFEHASGEKLSFIYCNNSG